MRAYLTLLLSLAAVWGASFMFIEIALDDLEPTTLMAGRLLVASVVLVSLMAARGMLGRLRRAGWRAFALGIINSALPFTLIAWGQQHIDSGVAAIANATVPIWVALLAIWFAQSERATGLRIVGIVLGLVGVAVLAGAQPEVDAWAIAGTLAVVVASILYAIASLFLQRETERLDTITLATATMLGATVALLAVRGRAGAARRARLGGDRLGGRARRRGHRRRDPDLHEDHLRLRPVQGGARDVPAPGHRAALRRRCCSTRRSPRWMVVGLVLILAGVALGSGLLRPSPSPEAVEPARP